MDGFVGGEVQVALDGKAEIASDCRQFEQADFSRVPARPSPHRGGRTMFRVANYVYGVDPQWLVHRPIAAERRGKLPDKRHTRQWARRLVEHCREERFLRRD